MTPLWWYLAGVLSWPCLRFCLTLIRHADLRDRLNVESRERRQIMVRERW